MIPFIDLKAQFAAVEAEVRRRMDAVLAHGQFIMGPEVKELEARLAAFAGTGHCVACSSGTDALLLALLAYGVGQGDAVLTTPFTFIASAEVISLLGATPVFVDIDPGTWNIDPERIEAALAALESGETAAHPLPGIQGRLTARGIIAVDIFGLPCDFERINAIARERGLFVIEDAAQSFGATYHGRPACSLTDVGCTSFFPAKPLGCFGDGGAVFTDDPEMAGKLRSLRVHGAGTHKYDNARIGINGRLDTLQAAILLAKMDVFPAEITARQKAADWYGTSLAGRVTLQARPGGLTSVHAQYSLRSPRREALMAWLKQAGIPTAVYYPRPLHLQTAFSSLGYREGDFPVSEAVSRDIFSLPMHPYLDEKTVEEIAARLISLLDGD